MGTHHEAIVRSFLDCLVAHDLEAALGHYANDATFHVSAWQAPLVGIEAIRGVLEREVALSDYRYTIRNSASSDNVVFTEVVDGFRLGDKDITMHGSSVWEINHAGKISARRDYWDAKEFDQQVD
jgi:limonene-1,2-epoxide hydrolase